MTITTRRTVSMGHRLPSYKGICSSPHGHNMTVEVEVISPYFLDFKEVDKRLGSILEPCDHAMLLLEGDPLLDLLRGMNFRTVACAEEPTTEYIAEMLMRMMQYKWDPEVKRVTVYETEKYSATVRS